MLRLVLVVVACGSCGDGTESRPGTEAAPSTTVGEAPLEELLPIDSDQPYPECQSVWVTGMTLPEEYFGCRDSDMLVSATGYRCASGGPLVIAPFIDGHITTPTGSTVLPNAGRHYARLGSRIDRAGSPMAQGDPGFEPALSDCLAS